MSVQSVALASLTATYTDSEGDDGPDDEQQHPHREQQHQRAQYRRRESSDVSQVDDSQNSNVTSQQCNALDSPLFGRSRSNSPDDETVVVVQHGNDGYNSRTNNRASSKNSQNAPTLVTDVTSKVQRLVSYFDDTVVSDDEMGTATAFDDNNHQRHQQSNYGTDATTISRKNNNAVTQSPKRQGELVSDCEEDDWGVTIPPEPAGQCPAELQEKISNLYRKMESGLDMNLHIQQRKEFRNPSIYEKLIQFCSINEMGTNYPPDRFDPLKWGKDSHYEELARIQKNEMDKLEKARKEKTKIEIVTGTAKRPNLNPINLAEDDAKRRKSKWDQVATGTTTTVKSNLVMSQPTLTTLTSSATGTKATVISAFGSLPRKRM